MALHQPNATVSRIDMMAVALDRMVSVGATYMYSGLQQQQMMNASFIGDYQEQEYTFETPRARLGSE